MIIFGQGAIRCHPFVLAEMEAAYNDNEREALAGFDQALFGHVGFVFSNLVRSVWLGLTDGRTSSVPRKDATARYYQQMNRYAANLALLADVSMAVLGGNLKRKERLSARLGDVLSQLYLASATMKRYADEGYQKADLPMVHWGMQDALYQAEEALDDFLANFPAAGSLRHCVSFCSRLAPAVPNRVTNWMVKLRVSCKRRATVAAVSAVASSLKLLNIAR